MSETIEIIVNGERRTVPAEATAAWLVEDMGLAGRRIAMEVNGEIVPRSSYGQHRFAAGDRVEIVQAIGGGLGV